VDGDRVNEQFVEKMRCWGAELEIRAQELRMSNELDEEDWARCPRNPSEQDYRALLSCRVYEIAVDQVADMQQQLRESNAWIAMIQAMDGVVATNSATVWAAGYPAANDNFMGVWVNDVMEDKVAWLMSVGIPVFIAHRYGPQELCRSARRENPALRDFLDGTETEKRTSWELNSCGFVARREGQEVSWSESDDGRDSDLEDVAHHQEWSSSLLLEARSRARVSGTELPTSPPERPEDPKLALRPLVARELYPGRVAWIVPPAIPSVRPGAKWEKWELCEEVDVAEGEECVFKRAKKWEQEEEEGRVWYDRELLREIYVYADYQEPAGVRDSYLYGHPAPRVKYIDGTSEKHPRRKPSYWMYRTRIPHQEDVGRRAVTPAVEDLPFAADSSKAPLSALPEAAPHLREVKKEAEEMGWDSQAGALEDLHPSL
jgi:hypothetical protein